MQEATPWIQVALNLIDMMGKVPVKPEVGYLASFIEFGIDLAPSVDRPKVEENSSRCRPGIGQGISTRSPGRDW